MGEEGGGGGGEVKCLIHISKISLCYNFDLWRRGDTKKKITNLTQK